MTPPPPRRDLAWARSFSRCDRTVLHPAFTRGATRPGLLMWNVGPSPRPLRRCARAQLCLDPRLEVVAAVEDAAAQAEAARTAAKVPPVPEGGHRGAEELGGFGDREQFGLAAYGLIRH